MLFVSFEPSYFERFGLVFGSPPDPVATLTASSRPLLSPNNVGFPLP